jgi:Na+-translocating ferredoxin:NAD+ oxidoreductase RNF subunit RnfB
MAPKNPKCGGDRRAELHRLHLCIQACPVDAILGAAKHMHTVIAKECTGCELCLAPCPVDCIHMIRSPDHHTWKWTYPGRSRVKSRRHERAEALFPVPWRLKTVRHKAESNQQPIQPGVLPRG